MSNYISSTYISSTELTPGVAIYFINKPVARFYFTFSSTANERRR